MASPPAPPAHGSADPMGNYNLDISYAQAYGPSDNGGFEATMNEHNQQQADFEARQQAAVAEFTRLVNGGMPPDQAAQQSGVNAINAEGQQRAKLPSGDKRVDIENSRVYAGTPWDSTGLDAAGGTNFLGGNRQQSYMYGRDPMAAQQAVDRAWGTGQQAQDFGLGIQNATWQTAQNYANRAAQQGDWTQQNSALAGAESYGDRLAGLEATQGPSAAQAQLQAGNNAAMAGQLALARSGRGFGGGAAAVGQAQSQLANLQGQYANSSAMLRAQEDAAWRQRQAGNLGAAAGIQQGIGQQYGAQSAADLNAFYQNRGMNDQTSLGYAGLGVNAANQGFQTNLAGQGLANDIRGQEMAGGLQLEDNVLREWAARNGYNLGQQQRQDQKEAGYMQAGASFLANVINQ